MKYLKSFYMALGLFSGIPLPFQFWDHKLTATMVLSLPVVGLFIGALWWAASLLLLALNLPQILMAALLTLLPFFLAGFIHLDGYLDTSDALLSRRPLADKLQILKDPRVGAFAVVMLAALFLLQFAAMDVIVEGQRYLVLLIAITTLSRASAALSILLLRPLPESSYAAMMAEGNGSGPKIYLSALAVATIALSFYYAGTSGIIVALTVVFVYAVAITIVYKTFQGLSGDLLGYALVISELGGLFALALLQGVA